MRPFFILIFFLSLTPLFAQMPLPVVRPPVYNHPNTTPPDTNLPPAPNPPNPYDPYGTRDSRPGSPFSEANAAAIHFLNIVDNHVWDGAWLDAGGILHDVVPQRVWAAGMRATRMHLGTVRARTVAGHQRAKSLPGGLAGDFMIIHYDTQFSYMPNAVETVTLMMHAPLGIWKVICYNVSP